MSLHYNRVRPFKIFMSFLSGRLQKIIKTIKDFYISHNIMKNFIKFLIIVWLSLLLWWTILTQTERGKDYARTHLSHDADLIKAQILDALNATGVVLTWTDSLSGLYIQYSDTWAVVVDQSILEQRLDYYKKSKDTLWKE